MAQETASVTITLDDQISSPLAAIQQQFERLSETMREISGAAITPFIRLDPFHQWGCGVRWCGR
jgi:hypothetical protein